MEYNLRASCFAALCTMLGVEHLTPTAYHPQSNVIVEQVESYDRHTTTEVCCREPEELRHMHATFNVRIQQADMQVHKYNPFRLVLLSHRHGPTTVSQPRLLTFDSYVNTEPR